jgi:hypothetical protein
MPVRRSSNLCLVGDTGVLLDAALVPLEKAARLLSEQRYYLISDSQPVQSKHVQQYPSHGDCGILVGSASNPYSERHPGNNSWRPARSEVCELDTTVDSAYGKLQMWFR